MTRTLPLFQAGKAAAVLAALLLVPASAAAQRATGTLIVRIEEAGAPVPGIDVAVVLRRTMQRVGTTGTSGIVGVDELTLDIVRGTRVSVGILRCGAETSALLIPEFESPGEIPDTCERVSAGHFFWGQSERILIRLDGDRATIEQTTARELAARLSGFRLSAQGLFTSLHSFETGSGSEEYDSGFGGEVRIFYMWPGGIGVGGGGSFTKHSSLEITNEDMSKWSAFVEPRYTFLIGSSKIRPHLLVRASYNWFDYASTPTGQPGGVNQKGLGFGGGAGVHYPVASWLGLEVGVYYGYLAMDFSGFDESRSGSELQLTAGLRFF
jgi:hypothetical protein